MEIKIKDNANLQQICLQHGYHRATRIGSFKECSGLILDVWPSSRISLFGVKDAIAWFESANAVFSHCAHKVARYATERAIIHCCMAIDATASYHPARQDSVQGEEYLAGCLIVNYVECLEQAIMILAKGLLLHNVTAAAAGLKPLPLRVCFARLVLRAGSSEVPTHTARVNGGVLQVVAFR